MPAPESATAPGKLSVGPLSVADAAAVADLAIAATKADQVAPLSEAPMLRLQTDQPWLTHLLVRETAAPTLGSGNVLGYAQVDRSGTNPVAELVVHPAYRHMGIGSQLLRSAEQDARIPSTGGTAGQPPPELRVWAHGNIPEAQTFAATHGYVMVRELLQLSRPLSDDSQGPNPFVSTWRVPEGGADAGAPAAPLAETELPTQAIPMQSMAAISRARAVRSRTPKPMMAPEQRPQPTAFIPPRSRPSAKPAPGADLPDTQSYQLRAFRPGLDDAAWVALNAAVFADHPEQGRFTLADLQARIGEPWFDANGFLLLTTAEGTLIAFCWTKVPTDAGVTAGEIYAIGVGSAYRRKGLAAFLLEAALSYFVDKGLSTVTLYVDSDNTSALETYRKVGFTPLSSDAQYAKRQLPTTSQAIQDERVM